VLLITGARDPRFTAISRRMAAELPMAWHAVLDAAHAVHLERTDEVAREVANFLDARRADEAAMEDSR
jgi:2-succinyl-6-hydroxy-2,4-cyclohexadiene-1-carboxylate synthase